MNIADAFEKAQHKTRVLVAGNEVQQLLKNILNFHGKNFDEITETSTDTENDFSIYFTHDIIAGSDFRPNIALITTPVNAEESQLLVSKMTSGGVLIYPENHVIFSEALQQTSNYFRQLPYSTSEYSQKDGYFIAKTSLGKLPLEIQKSDTMMHLEGLRLCCQQFGLMEEEFYEALLAVSSM